MSVALRTLIVSALSGWNALVACWSEWEQFEEKIGSYYDTNGCVVDQYERWWQRSMGGNPIDGDWNHLTEFVTEKSESEFWESDPHDCPDGGGDSCPLGSSSGSDYWSEGVNPFRVVDGDVTRKVTDLAVNGAAKGQLTWAREHHTVPRDGAHYFGVGGSWRHSWQYDLVVLPTTTAEPPAMALGYPSGAQRIFRKAANGTWAPSERFSEKIVVTNEGFEITTPKGEKLRFVENTTPGVPHRYEMREHTDPYGLVTRLQYGANGWLSRVTEPAGRWLQLDYSNVSFRRGVWHELGKIETAPAVGQWIELKVPAAAKQKPFRHLRLRGARGGEPIEIAEIEYYAANTQQPLRGIASGTSDNAEAAFDGDPKTGIAAKRPVSNVLGLDLGADNPSAVERVRVLAIAGREQTLVDAYIEGLEYVRTDRPVVAKVTASDGRSVSYEYAALSDPITQHEFVALKTARYGDGTSATYRYEWPRANTRPLLVEADDPRYGGPAKRIRYSYHDDLGVVHQEINPATGSVYVSLEFDPNDRQHRIVKYSDLREIHYRIAKDRLAIEERVDALGRSKRMEYDAVGRLVAEIDHKGNRVERIKEQNDRAMIERRNGKIENRISKDAFGRVVEKVDRHGRATKYERDANGRVKRELLPSGQTREFDYDNLGRITKFVDKNSGTHRFTYNEAGLRATWVNPDGGTTHYTYDQFGRVQGITDPLGATATREYNERGLITRIVHRDGTEETSSYDSYGRRVSATDSQGRTTRWTYDEMSRVTKTVAPNGSVTLMDYSDLPQGCSSCSLVHRPSRITGPDGQITEFLYDAEGRMLATTLAVGTSASATTTYSYDADDNLTSITDPLGNVTQFTYDDENRRLTKTDPSGRVTKWTYDERGNVLTIAVPNGGVTKMTYDAVDRLLTRTDALGNTTRYEYDSLGNLVTLTDASSNATRYSYDGKGRTATIYPDGQRETLSYDELGRIKSAVSSDGVERTIRYDSGSRVLQVIAADPRSRVTATTVHTYDRLGRRASTTDPLGRTTRWTYDALGNVLTTTRPDGLSSSNTHDALGRRTSSTDEAGNVTRFEYNDAGDMTALIDSRGSAYRFTYDARHRKTSMTYPDGSEEKWGYNLGGQLVSFTNRSGQTKTVSYNAAGQPLSEIWTQTKVASPQVQIPTLPHPTSYTYNAAGQLVMLGNGTANLTYTYDALGRLASETSDISAIGPRLAPQTVGYTYDALGRSSGLIYPDGTRVARLYDARGRVSAIDAWSGASSTGNKHPLAEFAYDAYGRIRKLTRDNGVDTTYGYDVAGQLTEIVHAKGRETLAASHYEIDVLGRRTAQTREDNVTERYGYDSTSQLTSADYGDRFSETFSYDPVGNRTRIIKRWHLKSEVTDYESNALNQYTKVRDVSFGYDANGNLINDGHQTYHYDAQNRLIEVESPTIRAELFYDARNRCVLRKYHTKGSHGQWVLSETESRALTYDTSWNVVSERSVNGTPAARYIRGRGTDEILRADLLAPSALHLTPAFPLADVLGSTVALANSSGSVTQRFRFTAYGTPSPHTSEPSPLDYRLLFTGREWLGGISLNDHRNRYYNPTTGRWNSVDPMEFRAKDINLYRYVTNSPQRYTDPFGLIGVSAAGVNPGIDTIVCNGQGGIRVQLGSSDGQPFPIPECRRVHEGLHRAQALNIDPNVCAGVSDGTLVQLIGDINPPERAAYDAELGCYDDLINAESDCFARSRLVGIRTQVVNARRRYE